VYRPNPREAALLAYYANAIVHLLAPPDASSGLAAFAAVAATP
jgi:hypothetical protein